MMSKDEELRKLRYDAAFRQRTDRRQQTLEQFARLLETMFNIAPGCSTPEHPQSCREKRSRLVAGNIISLIQAVIENEATFERAVTGGR
jgi:hypothetical protein